MSLNLNLASIADQASKKTAERVGEGGMQEVETNAAPIVTEKKRDFSSLERITVPKSKKRESKIAAREDNFTNNKNLHHNPGGRPSFYGESRTAHVTVRLRPTLLQLVMEYGEEHLNETSRNSIIERLLCKAIDVDVKTLEPRS